MSAVLDAAGGNTVIARDAGGWASATMVDEVYGHADEACSAWLAFLLTGPNVPFIMAAIVNFRHWTSQL